MNWHNFYLERMNDKYRSHIESRYLPFINYILQSAQNVEKIHEAGCGAANISRVLAKFMDKTLLLSDKCEEMLKLAKVNMAGAKCEITKLDLLKGIGPESDLTFSHGVLEHFSDNDIRTILKNQLKSSKTVIHYVPSNKYSTPSFGDERLMSVKDWLGICNPKEVIEFNDGYDLILTWRRE